MSANSLTFPLFRAHFHMEVRKLNGFLYTNLFELIFSYLTVLLRVFI